MIYILLALVLFKIQCLFTSYVTIFIDLDVPKITAPGMEGMPVNDTK